METPLVTVILPVYNGEPYLSSAFNSILNQSYSNLDIVVIDDGSKDASWKIIQAVNDQRIRAFQQTNIGLPATLNRGIELARGELIARMDQDDLSHPDRIKKQVAFLQEHLDIGVVGTSYELIDLHGKLLGKRFQLVSPLHVKRNLYVGNPFCHGSVMFRKQVVKTVGGYDTAAKVEDYELWIRLCGRTRMANLEEVLYSYRREVADSMVCINRDLYSAETRRLRHQLWSKSFPDLPWGSEARTISQIVKILLFTARYFNQTRVNSTGPLNRQQYKLHALISIGIAREFKTLGMANRVLTELAAMMLVHWRHPGLLARGLKSLSFLNQAKPYEL